MPRVSKKFKRQRVFRSTAVVEFLETRRLLSAIPNPVAQPAGGPVNPGSGTTAPTGYSPAQIKGAYGLSNVTIGGITGDGAGQTIAIVSAYDDPDFVDSGSSDFDGSDLHQFDLQMGLPDPPSFTKVNQNGQTSYPTTDSGWANETALDVEWTHAMAPDANILLVETYSANISDLIQGAMQYIDSVPAVSVVNMSFTVSEFSGENSYDTYLQTPSDHQGITVVAASGDDGEDNLYPSASPDVVSVGSTTLDVSGNDYGSETGYSGSGGGVSPYEYKPSFQSSVSQSQVSRTTPDVSIDGNPQTGLSVYDSFNGGGSPWFKIGGSSAAAVLWSGTMAVVDQDRVGLGDSTLNGATQTLPGLYSLSGSDFHDITVGNNGAPAGTGYDLVTGLGTPVANKLVPALAAVDPTVAVHATQLSFDQEPTAVTAGDNISPAITVDVDQSNGQLANTDHSSVTLSINGDAGAIEGTTTVNAVNGIATFSNVTIHDAGTYKLVATDGSLSSATSYSFVVSSPQSTAPVPTRLSFGQQPTTVAAGSTISPSITVSVVDPDGDVVTTDNAAITIALSNESSGVSLGGTTTVNAVGGVATFGNLSISGAGSYQLVVTSGTLLSATSDSFVVSAPAAVTLSFSQQPTTVTVGSAVDPAIVVKLLDGSGDLVTTNNSPVSLAIAGGSSGTTLGGVTRVNAVNGIATFNDLTVSAAGTFTLLATDGSLASADSNAFTVKAAYVAPVASRLAFSGEPGGAVAGVVIAPAITVDVEDSTGAVVTTDESAVTLSVASGPSGAALGGTLTVDAVNGVATFTGITASAAGSYKVSVSDGSLAAATSVEFTVAAAGTLTPVILTSKLPTSVVAGTKIRGSISVDVSNSAGNVSSGTVVTDVYAQGVTGTPVLLGTVTSRKLKLAAGKSTKVSVPVSQIPSTLTGAYSVYATVIDTAGNLAGSTTGASLAVLPAYVALTPAVTKLPLAANVVAGSKTSAAATVKVINSGTIASSGMTTIGIYASTNGSTASAVLVNSVSKKLSIKAGGAATVVVPLKDIPAAPAGGATYQLIAQVIDPAATVTTANSGVAVNVAAAFVSFQTSAAAVTPLIVQPGKSVTYEVTLVNTGNVAATGGATITIGLSSSSTGTGSVIVATTMRTAAVAVGKATKLRLKFVVPADTAAGSYFPVLTYTQAGQSATVVVADGIQVG